MKIGIDIDGVLTNDDDYILDHAIKYCYENNINSYVDPTRYETKKFDWNNETLDDYRSKYFYNYCKNEPARRFASEVINKLHQEGNEIYIITGRYKGHEDSTSGEEMRNIVKEWLKNNKIYYDNLIFIDAFKKVEYIKQNNIDIMIEDSPQTIPIISKIIPVLCYDCRYNRDLKIDNVTRVYSWYDIYSKLNNK